METAAEHVVLQSLGADGGQGRAGSPADPGTGEGGRTRGRHLRDTGRP